MRKPKFRRVISFCECSVPEEMQDCNCYESFCKKRYYNKRLCDHCVVEETDDGNGVYFSCAYN